jgi:predicted ArsR family transcriptional regulator
MTREAGQKESPLDTLPTTRRAILNLLKREGPLTANAVARALSLTSAAIRMQLVHLEEDGLLARDESVADTGRRGRPSHVYTLTSAAEALYPKRYGDLTTELLGYLGGPDGEQVNALFEQRRRRRVDGALPRLAHLSFEARGWELAHHRAQLRHSHRGPRVLPSVLERALLHPRRVAGRIGGAGGPPDGRRPRVRLPANRRYVVATT